MVNVILSLQIKIRGETCSELAFFCCLICHFQHVQGISNLFFMGMASAIEMLRNVLCVVPCAGYWIIIL